MPENNTQAIVNGTVYIDRKLVPGAVVIVRDGKIAEAGPAGGIRIPERAATIDATDRYVVPGFIDIHIHGAVEHGVEEGVVEIARWAIQGGTTFFLPTCITDLVPSMLAGIDHVRGHLGPVDGGATIGGIHLEGPYLSSKYGAQDSTRCVDANAENIGQLIDRCDGNLRMVTVSPEVPGVVDAIKAFRAAGAVVAGSHSEANEQQYLAARAAGLTHATHLFNAMISPPGYGRENFVGVKAVGIEEFMLADDDVTADIMADAHCFHVHFSLLKIAFKCKGEAGKLSLLTDAIPCAGLPPGEHKLADGRTVFIKEGEDVGRIPGGMLCGSGASMIGVLRNFMRHTGLPLDSALITVTEAPARTIGVYDSKGSIAPGKDADIVMMDRDHEICTVMIDGKIEFEGNPGR